MPPIGKRPSTLVGLAILLIAACGEPNLTFDTRHEFLERHRVALEELDNELRTYGRIHHMSDGLRHFKQLNGELITYVPPEVDTAANSGYRQILPIDTVLVRHGIERSDYESLRQKLIQTTFTELLVHEGYTAFLHDGFLDNVYGYVLVKPGAKPPSLNIEFFGAELVLLDEVAPGWYYFATT